jgi:L,D-transpeptidase ErfK/SrfK
LPEAPREGLVLNIATKRLFYFPAPVAGEPAIVETYPIGIGREGWATPTGETSVVSKARDPVWFVPASIREEHAAAGDPLPAQVPPGPDNPLGTRVLGLGIPGYLIHGTNKPAGVGMRVSHGCVRLYPEDIESLFERVPLGTPVRIVNQPYLFGWQAGDLLLEAHPPLDEDPRDWTAGLAERARASLVDYQGPPPSIALERLAAISDARRSFPVSVLSARPGLEATAQRAQPVENIVTYEWLADRDPD